MAKAKTTYVCNECGDDTPQWAGKCPSCGAWDSLKTFKIPASGGDVAQVRRTNYSGETSKTVSLGEIDNADEEDRTDTHMSELNRVLGGGLVAGSVVLIGGDPGIGKSTLLLQVMASLSQTTKVLYVTGEESIKQISARSKRLGLKDEAIKVLTETSVDRIINTAQKEQPKVMVIDSIQTIYTEVSSSAPGSVSQVRESAAQLVRFAKQMGVAMFLVGHVTKEGAIAGPRVLEHMVDTVLYFEGDAGSRFRVIRAMKNRFGAVNELGVFAMTESGLKEVSNPSEMFLSNRNKSAPGSATLVTKEGTRPLLVELQALVDESFLPNPRRVSLGFEQNRIAMLLAVLHKHGGVATYNQDVFINIAGGVKVTETAADLAVMLAVISSLKNEALPEDLVMFGEIGLSGEVRPVPSGEDRLNEAVKHGFKRAIVPKANVPKKKIKGLEVIGVAILQEALKLI